MLIALKNVCIGCPMSANAKADLGSKQGAAGCLLPVSDAVHICWVYNRITLIRSKLALLLMASPTEG